jgi:hypothetical protein
MPGHPTFGFIGDLLGEVATGLSDDLNLVEFSGSLDGTSGVVVDGTSKNAVDLEQLRELADAGGIMAAVWPDPSLRSRLIELTGQGPASDVVMFAARKPPGGAYRFEVIGPVTVTTLAPGEAPSNSEIKGSVAECGARLASFVDVADVAPPTPPSLLPPSSYLACAASTSPVVWNLGAGQPWTAPYPAFGGNFDDKVVRTNNQQIAGTYIENTFYIYWVNGQATPEYVVILQQRGTVALGNPNSPSGNSSSEGYFQCQFSVGPNTLQAQAVDVPTSAIEPLSNSGGGFTLQVPMQLWDNATNGTSTFQATDSAAAWSSTAGWDVQNQSTSQVGSWIFHQTGGWDPTVDEVSSWPSWESSVFVNGDVPSLPSQSWGSITFGADTVWTITATPPGNQWGPAPQAPVSVGVTVAGNFEQQVALFHNSSGCAGASGSSTNHLFTASCAMGLLGIPGWTWQISDLSTLIPAGPTT